MSRYVPKDVETPTRHDSIGDSVLYGNSFSDAAGNCIVEGLAITVVRLFQ
jgi:hypothetical protein